MHEHHQDIFDVIIAGAGPVGLFLACELRLFDLSVLVLEQAEHPHSPLKRLPSGMRGLSAPTLEAFYRRGFVAWTTETAPRDEEVCEALARWFGKPGNVDG